jgi:hypothetical protein
VGQSLVGENWSAKPQPKRDHNFRVNVSQEAALVCMNKRLLGVRRLVGALVKAVPRHRTPRRRPIQTDPLLKKRLWSVYVALLLVALSFRLFVALRLANDEPDDGKVYSQIAINVLEQHVYSHDTQSPYVPSLIRLPGYPLFLATVYKVFGHGNNTAVRVAQAVTDAATCALIALVAFEWAIDPERKHRAAIIAFALAAVCPFTAIYAATILTEVPTSFLAVAMVLTVTFAIKATLRKRALAWWVISGLIAGLAVLFRPDSGLFAAAVGCTLLIAGVGAWSHQKHPILTRLLCASLFSLAFCVVLVPWTIRNWRVFHLFQPLAPAHAEMPGEFVPRGYLLWVRTWLDDSRYVGPALWSVDTRPLAIDDFPDSAFDSEEERDRVEALLDKYNNLSSSADEEDDEQDNNSEENAEMTPEIDAGFAQLGKERLARSRLRYYVV